MDDRWASQVINMDLTGSTPPPRHVRVIGDEDLADYVREIENRPDEIECFDDRTGTEWVEPPDVHDETTNIARPYEITIGFETWTDLEARLCVDAVTAFMRRRTTASEVVVTFRRNF